MASAKEDPLAIAGELVSALSRLGQSAPRGFRHLSEIAPSALAEIEAAYEGKNPCVGIPSGLGAFDARIGGFPRGGLTVLAGRPSMGKTALATAAGLGAAHRGYPVGFVTIESPAKRIFTRMLSATTGIENRNILRGTLEDREITAVVSATGKLSSLPIWPLEGERRWDNIAARIRGLKLSEPKLAAVFVDYIGLVSAPVKGDQRYLELGRITAEAKTLAVELDLAMILLSQLNRGVEGREDKRPRLSDLRESGCIEQDADIVGLLYRPGYYSENEPPTLAELDIAKNRDGATGVIKLEFREKTASFHDFEERN